jgi:hypothetical protein
MRPDRPQLMLIPDLLVEGQRLPRLPRAVRDASIEMIARMLLRLVGRAHMTDEEQEVHDESW